MNGEAQMWDSYKVSLNALVFHQENGVMILNSGNY